MRATLHAGAALLAAGLLALTGCAPRPEPVGDPLVERIFRVADVREISPNELLDAMAAADVVYLGEKHDSARQHEQQLEILKQLVERGLRPALGFEVFAVEQTSELVSYVTAKSGGHGAGDEDALRRKLRVGLGWDDEDSQSWRSYGPLLEFAREHGLTVFGADLGRALRQRISRVGVAGLGNVERGLLRPSNYEDPDYEALMRNRLKATHCGFGSDEYLGRLYDNWVARNDTMAAAVIQTIEQESGKPVVLVLGAGHIQHGMGVYERVSALRAGVRQVNLGLRELLLEPWPVEHYVQPTEFEGMRFGPDHDYLWFSAPADEPGADPCEAFLEHMKKRQS
jgi:uncharacterized iron-regulated protein